MTAKVWSTEIWRLLIILMLGLLLGSVFGMPWIGMCVALILFIGRYMQQLWRLVTWLENGGNPASFPDLHGALGQLAFLIYRRQQRYRERKQRLAAMLSQFTASAEAIPDAAVVLGLQGEIEWLNRASTDLMGLKSPRDIGQRIDNLLREPGFKDYLRAYDYKRSIEVSSPINPDMLLSVRIVPYANNKRLLTARDISENARLRQIRKDFVANVSHELRTPLTVMAGYLETFLDEPQVPLEVGAGMRQVQSQVQRMNRIVADLLTLSQLEAVHLSHELIEPVPMSDLLDTLVHDARQLSGADKHEFKLEVEPNLSVLGREAELTSLFSNLINNAVQHNPEGTLIELRWYSQGDQACFVVKDHGAGIAPQHLDRLTERFYRVDAGRSRDQGGTGLGLAIVKHILQRHGAELSIHSELGQGSEFRCCFPQERSRLLTDK